MKPGNLPGFLIKYDHDISALNEDDSCPGGAEYVDADIRGLYYWSPTAEDKPGLYPSEEWEVHIHRGNLQVAIGRGMDQRDEGMLSARAARTEGIKVILEKESFRDDHPMLELLLESGRE